MSTLRTQPVARNDPRVDLVDNWHKDWPKVLSALQRYTDAANLHIGDDGWLPARQNLLVAFVEGEPAAHVCFHVEPAQRNAKSAPAGCVAARLDSYGIDPRFCGHGIELRLGRAARERAGMLRCQTLHGFELDETWC